jgi:predicted acylesterase/phospholipase RssA
MDYSAPAPATTPANAQRVLVLQGGGALGSYQAGAFQALCHAGFEPEWIAGISIGAINAAIIAGNGSETRVDRLKEFWEMVSSPVSWSPVTPGDRARSLFNETSATRQPAIAELLRHRAAEEDAGAAGRLRPYQRPEDAAQRRRGRRDFGQSEIF